MTRHPSFASQILSFFLVAVFLLVIGNLDFGWNVAFLKSIFPTYTPLSPVLGLVVLLGAGACAYNAKERLSERRRLISIILALLVLFFGGISYVLHVNEGLRVMLLDPNGGNFWVRFFQMFLDVSLSGSILSVVLGLVLVFGAVEIWKLYLVAQVYVVPVVLLSFTSLLAHYYNLTSLYGLTQTVPIDAYTALFMFILGLMFFLVRPDRGVVTLFSKGGPVESWYRDATIRSKLLCGFGGLISLLLVYSMVSYTNVAQIHYNLLSIQSDMEQANTAMMRLGSTGDRILYGAQLQSVEHLCSDDFHQTIQEWHGDYLLLMDHLDNVIRYYAVQGNVFTRLEFERVKQLTFHYYDMVGASYDSQIQQLIPGDTPSQKTLSIHTEFCVGGPVTVVGDPRISPEGLTQITDIRSQSRSISAFLDRKSTEVRLRITQDIDFVQRLLLLFAVLFILLGVTISSHISQLIASAVQQLKEQAKRIAQGDFHTKIALRGKDELSDLAHSLREMTTRLLEMNTDMERALEQLNTEKAKDEALLQSIGDGLIATDDNRRIIFANHVALGYLGRRHEEIIGQYYHEVIRLCDEQGKRISKQLDPHYVSLVHSRVITDNRFYYQKQNGDLFPVAITVSPINLKGKHLGTIQVFRDISRDKEIDRAKNEFLSLASHQLRTPLTSLKWNLEILMGETFSSNTPEQKQVLEESYQSAERMGELVNALLNVSNVQLGSLEITPVFLNIAELVSDVLKENRPMIERKKIIITTSYTKEIHSIPLDRKLTLMVLQNLITNAVKYTPEKGQVTIATNLVQEGQWVGEHRAHRKSLILTVSDTGVGIPKEQQEKIFSKLFRAENAQQIDPDGNGLGLYLTRTILESVGGHIWFESTPGKGTTFFVILPYAGMEAQKGNITLH